MTPIRPENKALYPANWDAISERIRLSRAGNRCECDGECGSGHVGRCIAHQGGINPETNSKVVLTVAHLDHDPTNCQDSNLKALCQRCHNNYDADHRVSTRARTKAAEAATWMQPLFDDPKAA